MALLAPLPGRLLERRGNASPRGMAAGQRKLPYRTRLIGGLPIPPSGHPARQLFRINFYFTLYHN